MVSDNLPEGVHLLSFQKIEEGYALIRLENYLEGSVRTVSLQVIKIWVVKLIL